MRGKGGKLDSRGHAIATKNVQHQNMEEERRSVDGWQISPSSGLFTQVATKIIVVPQRMYIPSGKLDSISHLMIITDQNIHFERKYTNLIGGKDLEKGSDIYTLSPFLYEGILEIHMSLFELLPEQYAYPVNLAKGRLAELIIWDCHIRLLHSGLEQTKREARNRYWIFGGKWYISTVFTGCRHIKFYLS